MIYLRFFVCFKDDLLLLFELLEKKMQRFEKIVFTFIVIPITIHLYLLVHTSSNMYIDSYTCTYCLLVVQANAGGDQMIINREVSKPVYLQVADYLRNNIYSEEWGKGEQIPSENQIMKSLEVSRGTVKKAVKVCSTRSKEKGLM